MTKKRDPLPVRLDHDAKDALEADAKAQERSQAWLVNRIVRKYYGLDSAEAEAPKGGKAAKSK